jgi:hypothetical protein
LLSFGLPFSLLYPAFVPRKVPLMKATPTADTGRDTKPSKATRNAEVSPDGKWRSFPKVPNLVQYVGTGTYFGRVKIEGKVFRQSFPRRGASQFLAG